MALRLLADADVILQVERLTQLMQSPYWIEFWQALEVELVQFAEISLDYDVPDLEVWQTCQRFELVLLTNNRNARKVDSLEPVIRDLATSESLPVFTFANLDRFRSDRTYAETVVGQLYDYLFRLDDLRGSGRLYLP